MIVMRTTLPPPSRGSISNSSTRPWMSGSERPRSKLKSSELGSVSPVRSDRSASSCDPRSVTWTTSRSPSSSARTWTGSSEFARAVMVTAFVAASDTASFTLSTRSGDRPPMRAAAPTTWRTSATYSGFGGISISASGSFTASPAPGRCATGHGRSRRLQRLVERAVDGEHLRQSSDVEDLHDAVLRDHELQVAVARLHALQPPDQHAEPGRVEVVDLVHVDDDVGRALADEVDERLAQARCGVHIDLAAKRDDAGVAGGRRLEIEVHVARKDIPQYEPGRTVRPWGRAPGQGRHGDVRIR